MMSDGFRETEPETENKTEEMLRRSRFRSHSEVSCGRLQERVGFLFF